ncbi:MAG: asparagine synthetase B [Proteobacteria bacterium]|nr:asparagine synthetase B [Pseudomonadota bacterium]
MCGILVSKRRDANNFFIQKRGPDLTSTIHAHGYYFTHNLLHITGKVTPQPFVDGDIVCVYNGEIYNHAYHDSDGEVLIPLYREHGEDFARHLDGEFAVAIYDFGRGVAVFATDPFSTKPMWRNGTEVASYLSGVGADGEQVSPDTTVIVDLASGEAREVKRNTFDFDHQHKDSYDDWIAAFDRAMAKRAYNHSFINLSSGYDSGAIDCALTRLGIEYKAFSIEGQENLDLLRQRNRNGTILKIDRPIINEKRAYLRANAEPYKYRLTMPNGNLIEYDMLDDKATVGLASIYTLANQEKRRVNFSGQGADEIMSDYSQWPEATQLKGVFPEKLAAWRNFYGNYQRAYLTKEEHVAGAYGIETRYPFLDREVVQEFLWLTPELKNRRYKAPLYEYLTRNGYPFDAGKKMGFLVI